MEALELSTPLPSKHHSSGQLDWHPPSPPFTVTRPQVSSTNFQLPESCPQDSSRDPHLQKNSLSASSSLAPTSGRHPQPLTIVSISHLTQHSQFTRETLTSTT